MIDEQVIGPIIGYKAFNPDFTNSYGMKFELDKTYKIDGEIKFGVKGNGFHFCECFEDTFRYFETKNGILLTKVEGNGHIVTYDDEYNGYYDMHASSELKILEKISREEIMEMIKKIAYAEFRMRKVIQTLCFTDEEIEMLDPYFQKSLKTDVHYKKKVN